MKKTTIIATLAVIGLGLGIAGDSLAQVDGTPVAPVTRKRNIERHPELRRAMHALTNAKKDLLNAARDFGGHRAKAASLVDAAMAETREAIKYDK